MVGSGRQPRRQWHPYADLVLRNANVITVDAGESRAQAVAIKDGRFIAVGSGQAVEHAVGAPTRVVDLGGRTVIPGLVDGHAHMDREGLRDIFPSLADARSIADIQQRIRELASQTPPGEWIVTMPIGQPPYYFDAAKSLAEGRFPTRAELDAAAPDHPVYIRGIWGFWDRPPIVSVANTRALQVCGITRDTVPPCDTVEIERDPASGELTGTFREHHEIPVLEFTLFRQVPRFTHEHRLRGLRTAMRRYHSAGTTSVYEGHGVSPDVQAVYLQLYAAGELTMRSHLVVSPSWGSLEEADAAMGQWLTYATGRGTGDDRLRYGGVYMAIGRRKDVPEILHRGLPYTGWAGFCELDYDAQEFRALAGMAARHNLRLHTVVNSEDILETVLEVLEGVNAETSIAGRRWVVEHVRTASREAIRRMCSLDVIATTQPCGYIWKGGAAAVAGGLDPDRLVPHADFLAEGLPFALSTDNKPYSALWAWWAAVERTERLEGRVIGASQRLTPLQALRALTLDAARLSFEEHVKGSIEVGKYADLVVLTEDPLAIDPARIRDLEVQVTLIGGEVVHSSNEDLLALG